MRDILTYWHRNMPGTKFTLGIKDGRVMCRLDTGQVVSTGWRSEAQVRAEFVDLNHNVDYKWHHQCTRRAKEV